MQPLLATTRRFIYTVREPGRDQTSTEDRRVHPASLYAALALGVRGKRWFLMNFKRWFLMNLGGFGYISCLNGNSVTEIKESKRVERVL